MPSVPRDRATELIRDGLPHHACCGVAVGEKHIPECTNFVAVERPERCSECGMIGFHRPQCASRTTTAENPKHYEHPSGVETISVNRCMTFCAGSAFKYMLRYEDKLNPPEDLRKARWYVADVEEFTDPIWISPHHKGLALPKLRTMLEHETNEYRREFFEAILDFDIDRMAEVIESARESVA